MKKKKKKAKPSSLEEEILSLFETKKKPLLLRELYHLLNIPKLKGRLFVSLSESSAKRGSLSR
jgi:ribonuclease R